MPTENEALLIMEFRDTTLQGLRDGSIKAGDIDDVINDNQTLMAKAYDRAERYGGAHGLHYRYLRTVLDMANEGIHLAKCQYLEENKE